ncbi:MULTISPECIES: 5-(carboxyamino)imidazole ribonucleotide synthase [Brevibacillus]|jgi:5-(carboxyamino)imidazole ribonucleotide synthase|uniref:N5-carboxyaminoimidazole ribonucleotide synthase n=1 Tax=Brevibacillus borstelensis AK1 TaxID=1300222 RepID=M8D6J3_9BACL|nr:5-(carboxyamino)imidazole ribonucleotide synthase [Brevibacillus borstelensis]EMT51889.1 phosphoribosylaminoimidazole carboxylase ATPase subunit [Brevibacillus borstelensis AK1]KKX56047.1 phosphoribosylaminoimidazole carboxylase [Brevibacillus borstelensis cifa_chp40]MBE5398436.1 5-(carboxyamino)imidazole ribonucleotide synthase [Brevibacillus borstelensis]MCC0565908.1 5-(carboxyamino)imidazole ribonucleotide synthase [Brevibacillus borstelensis]MCM3473089.1 5-(carboxyamino)imidazole ribonu
MMKRTETLPKQNNPIKPGATIGILGGGQLGRMIALAGRAMGYRFVTLDPTEDAPCGQTADRQIVARYDDVEAALELAQASDVISYEFENVDAQVAEVLESRSYVPQGSRLLRITQHRIREKTAIRDLGIPVAPFRVVDSADSLRQAVGELGLPAVMKTATGGYDGKGQWVLRSMDEIDTAYETLSKAGTELIVEKFVPFVMELSVIAARNPSGELAVFPAAENVHVDNILHLSIVPARVPEEVRVRAEEIARTIAEKLDVVGLIAVEMFLSANGELYVNELAPRPHNSGHYTMDACVTSQFEQHVRAVCNLPLGSTELLSPVVMANILGEHLEPVLERIERLPRTAKLHLYGKADSKPKRKMGHINVLAPTVEEALAEIERLEIWTNKAEGQQ